jgi:cobalt-zinc-cadmium efflux system outer membrane protein
MAMTRSSSTKLILWVACALLVPTGLAAQRPEATDTLSIAEVYSMVAAANPMLAAARARVDALRSIERSAGLPPDPQVQLGVMNASLPGLQTNMPTSMAPSIEVMQMVPLPGKLGLASEIARTETEIARTESSGVGWMARTRAAMAYHEIYRIDRQVETMERTLDLLRDIEEVARAMYGSGEGHQADVLRAAVEIARMRGDIERMTAMRSAAVARLNGVLNRPADMPVIAVAEPSDPEYLPPAAVLRGWAAESSPSLVGSDLGVRQATTRAELARRELWPDLSIGVQYGQRSGEMGTERMGSLMVGFSLPVFARQRQLKMRDEAAAMERMAAAELGDAQNRVDARIGELLAEIDRDRTMMELYRSEVLPPALAVVESSFSSYRAGAADFMVLLDARMMVNEYEQELYRLQAEYAQAVAELEMTIGRELPTVAPTGEKR